ncbi:MAG: hypothetical protein H7Y00_10035, partial [Fimbriimonadaceae bacterium]|nr:hypothetical protein [Chitinophagales bacterium]
ETNAGAELIERSCRSELPVADYIKSNTLKLISEITIATEILKKEIETS